jgi:hypothetical protein
VISRRGAAAPVLIAVAALAGCSTSSGAGDSSRTSSESLAAGTGGAWADEFQTALSDSRSDFERTILADGAVTDDELAAAHDGVRSCLADSGYDIKYFDEGGFEVSAKNGKYPDGFQERMDPVLRACEGQFDESVTFLYQQVRRNPERLDDATITVACLRKAGLVDPGYSNADYSAENDTGEWSFDDTSDAGRRCAADPLGLWMD